jgi:hypothetical protein
LPLVYFHTWRIPDCLSTVDTVWQHLELLNKLAALFVALLTVENAIRANATAHVEPALAFLGENFPTPADAFSLLAGKIGGERLIAKMAEDIRWAFRLSVSFF